MKKMTAIGINKKLETIASEGPTLLQISRESVTDLTELSHSLSNPALETANQMIVPNKFVNANKIG